MFDLELSSILIYFTTRSLRLGHGTMIKGFNYNVAVDCIPTTSIISAQF